MAHVRSETRTTLRWASVLIPVAAVLVLLAVNGIVNAQFDETRRTVESVNENDRIRLALRSLVVALQDFRSGTRDYMLDGDRSFFKSAQAARLAIDQASSDIGSFARTHPWMKDDFDELRRLSDRRLALADEMVASARNGDIAAARRIDGQVRDLAGQTSTIVDRMDTRLARALTEASEETARARRIARRTALAFETALILLIVAAALLAVRMIRARQKTAERLASSDARQRAIFDNASDGMIVLNTDAEVESLNPAAAKMLGYVPDQLIGLEADTLMADAPGHRRMEAFLAGLLTQEGSDGGTVREIWGQRSDGSRFPADVAVSPIPLPDATRYLAVIRDVSERKRLEQLKSEFVSTVSHELRTPLTSIAGSLGLLHGTMKDQLPDQANRLIAIAQGNSERLVRLINDILDIEKIESGKMTFVIRPIELRRFLEGVIETNQGYALTRGVRLVLGEVPGDAVIMADEDRLAQVMSNLLSNAAKFSPEREDVTVSAVRFRHWIRINVADRGPGISDAFRERIFGKFAQEDSSDARQKGGTGLGLAIVREIMTRLGGAVGYDSIPGIATTFHVDLPAAAQQPDLAATAPWAEPADHTALPRILHLEDDSDMLAIMVEAFDGDAIVRPVPTVADAAAAIARERLDAAILDIAMPDGSGLDLIGPLRRANPGIPIVIFTALDTDEADLADVNAVFTKSKNSLPDLVSVVSGLIGRGRNSGEP